MTARWRIAEHAAAVLAERELEAVSWGEGVLVTIAERVGVAKGHPLARMERVLAAPARAPDLFEPSRLHGHDRRGRPRLVRMFRRRSPAASN